MKCGDCDNTAVANPNFPDCVYCRRYLLHMHKNNEPKDCKYYIAKPKTNADKLRSMSDEELAEWIKELIENASHSRINDKGVWGKAEIAGGHIIPWIDWLRREAET